LQGRNAVMPVIVRKSNKPYKWAIEAADLKDIANKEKMMPRDFITADGFHITDKCRQYLSRSSRVKTTRRSKNGCPITSS